MRDENGEYGMEEKRGAAPGIHPRLTFHRPHAAFPNAMLRARQISDIPCRELVAGGSPEKRPPCAIMPPIRTSSSGACHGHVLIVQPLPQSAAAAHPAHRPRAGTGGG